MLYCPSVRTRNAGVERSSPPLVTVKTPTGEEGNEETPYEFTSLEKTRCSVFGFCYALNRVCYAVYL